MVLLNSDALVTNAWLDEMLACVTEERRWHGHTFSNNATICSFPDFTRASVPERTERERIATTLRHRAPTD